MLRLTRLVGQTIRIGDDIEVHIDDIRGGAVRLGLKAPRDVPIYREEVYQQIAEAKTLATEVATDALGALTASTRDAAVPPQEFPSADRSA